MRSHTLFVDGVSGCEPVEAIWDGDGMRFITRDQMRDFEPPEGPDGPQLRRMAIGFGVLGMAAAFIGRDTWRFSVISVLAGTLLLIYGVARNRRFLGELIANRGPLRRRTNVDR